MQPTPSGIRNGDGYDWGAVAADLSQMMVLADERVKEGGYIWMDERGEYHSRFRSYEETWRDQWKSKAEGWMKVPANKMKLFLYRRGLLKMSGTEALWLMIETDDRKKKEALSKFKRDILTELGIMDFFKSEFE